MPEIFLSYRRADAAATAGRLFDRLSQHFGRPDRPLKREYMAPALRDAVMQNARPACSILFRGLDADGKRQRDFRYNRLASSRPSSVALNESPSRRTSPSATKRSHTNGVSPASVPAIMSFK
jgi:hypothetical protein